MGNGGTPIRSEKQSNEFVCMHAQTCASVSNMSWERSFVPVQVTLGERHQCVEWVPGEHRWFTTKIHRWKKKTRPWTQDHTHKFMHIHCKHTYFTGFSETPLTVWLPACQHFSCTPVTHTSMQITPAIPVASLLLWQQQWIHSWDNHTGNLLCWLETAKYRGENSVLRRTGMYCHHTI